MQSTSEAAALGVVRILAAVCLVAINRVAGTRMGDMFG
jgi:hypothetical protein